MADDVLTAKDFINYGGSPELEGRIGLTCRVDPLSREELKKVLLSMKTSVIYFYREEFAEADNTLEFDNTALDFLIDEAAGLPLGVRGLRNILTPYMSELLYDMADKHGVKVKVTGENLKKGTMPVVRRKAQKRSHGV